MGRATRVVSRALGLALVLASSWRASAQAAPSAPARWQSTCALTVDAPLAPATTLEGTCYYDGVARRSRQDFSKKFKPELPVLPASAIVWFDQSWADCASLIGEDACAGDYKSHAEAHSAQYDVVQLPMGMGSKCFYQWMDHSYDEYPRLAPPASATFAPGAALGDTTGLDSWSWPVGSFEHMTVYWTPGDAPALAGWKHSAHSAKGGFSWTGSSRPTSRP